MAYFNQIHVDMSEALGISPAQLIGDLDRLDRALAEAERGKEVQVDFEEEKITERNFERWSRQHDRGRYE